jgi:hypothetical protein
MVSVMVNVWMKKAGVWYRASAVEEYAMEPGAGVYVSGSNVTGVGAPDAGRRPAETTKCGRSRREDDKFARGT